MCDNTAPYTAQEVHLVTTKFKIVDKYTVEYICVLTQAQSSLKHTEGIKTQQVWHTKGKIYWNKAGKWCVRGEWGHRGTYWMDRNEALKNMTRTEYLSRGTRCSIKRERVFLQQLMGAPIPQLIFTSVCVAAATGTPRTQERFLYRRIKSNGEI